LRTINFTLTNNQLNDYVYKVLILIFFIFSSSVASHSNEKNIEIIGESKRAIYMIEVDSVEDAKGEGTYIEFITITSLKKPNKLQDGTNYLSVRTTHIGDCGEKKIKDIKTQFFDKKMKNGDFTKLNLIKTESYVDTFWADAKTVGKVNTAIMKKACLIRFQNIINPKDGDPPAFSLDLLKKTKP
tara:strand:+ start:192 stop:746 length:555 start_codon:yes stop_codon:yes gene_type:complete